MAAPDLEQSLRVLPELEPAPSPKQEPIAPATAPDQNQGHPHPGSMTRACCPLTFHFPLQTFSYFQLHIL